MISKRVVCREFIGRADELAHLRARRKAAAEGRGGLVLVGGEAGIGKSRLVREFCAHLAPARHHVAGAGCREFGQRPLAPLGTVLRGSDGKSPLDERAPSRDEQLSAILEAFDRIGERGTAVLVLEDLHWGDALLLGTLDVLAERAETRRVLVIGTYRDDEIVAGHPLFVPFGRLLRRDATSLLKLAPLTRANAGGSWTARLRRSFGSTRTTCATCCDARAAIHSSPRSYCATSWIASTPFAIRAPCR